MGESDLQAIRFFFIDKIQDLLARQIEALYKEQGWWANRDDEKKDLVARLIKGSHCFAVAMEGKLIVGMGRAISDGVSDAYIQDLTVRRQYQGRGIGSHLLNLIIARLLKDGIRWIGLIAEPGSKGFYLKAGFREFKEATPFLMIKE